MYTCIFIIYLAGILFFFDGRTKKYMACSSLHSTSLFSLSPRLACSVTHGHISNFTLQVAAQKIQFVFVSLPFSAISIKREWLTSKIDACFQTSKTNGVDS
ncbi:hypothetical protein GOODEAATRI_018633 [Goodea atripinnis]|uniref:Secreted protein n=1 Tax=Goodea atripinnis TaxID=208336 RepID=A0ABV0P5X9_9TELE